MSPVNTKSALLRHTRENLDVLVFAAFFTFLIVDSFNYHEITRQFPLTFLVLGLLFLVAEFSIDLLPERYANTMRQVTAGLTEDIEEEFEEKSGESTETEPSSDGILTAQFSKITVLLAVFLTLIYVIGFLPAAIVFIYLASYTIGSKNFVHTTAMALFMIVLIYGVFGELFNVPIFEAVFDISEQIGWL